MNIRTEDPTTRTSLISTAVRNSCYFAGILAGSSLLPAALGADIQWTGTTGTWTNTANWSTGTIPGPDDFAWVGNGGTVQIAPGDPIWTTQDFRTGAGGAAGTMDQTGGLVNITSWFRMGVDPGSTGTYNMSGGVLNIRNARLNLGEKGAGVLNMTGGLIVHGNGQLIAGNRDNGAESGPTATGVINQSGGTFTNESEVWIGFGVNGDNTDFGTFNLTGGTFNVRRWFVMGRTGGEGVLNVSGANTLVAKSGEDGHMILGDVAGGNNPKGTVNQNGGTVQLGSECWIGQTATATGIYNLNSGTILANNWFSSGRAGGTGTFNMSGGNLVKTGGGSISIGGGGGASDGTWNHSGGLIEVREGSVFVGENGSGIGRYTLSDTAELRATNLVVSQSETVDGVLTLNGGTARVARIFRAATDPLALGTANFNGSQIIATSDQANFISGLTTADVQAGGLLVNSDTYTLGTPQLFTGSGGITKSGLGVLTINAPWDPTGASAVTGGVLGINSGTFSGASLTLSNSAAITGDNSVIAAPLTVAASGGTILHSTAYFNPIEFGNLTLNGPTNLDFSDAALAPGTYTVATYTGTLTGGGNLKQTRPGSISLATAGEINVTVGAVRNLTWTGATNSNWDIFSTANFNDGVGAVAFGQGDSLSLGDSVGATPITVSGAVRPAALTVNNSAGNTVTINTAHVNSTITGTVALAKQGDGKALLDIDATLSSTSSVAITGGELQVGNGGTTGSLGLAPISNSGVLHINLNRDRIFTNAITGSGTGSFVKSGTGNVTLTGAFSNPGTTTVNGGRLTLISPAVPAGAGAAGTGTTIGAGAEMDIRVTANTEYFSVLNGSGKLIKTGGSELFLNGDNTNFTGDIEVSRGGGNSLNIRHVNALGSTSGKTVVRGLNGTGGQHLNIRNLGGVGPYTVAEPLELRASAFGRAGFTHEGGSQTLNYTGPIGVYSTGRSAVNIRNFNATSTLNLQGDITGTMGGATLFVRGSSGPINITGGIDISDDAELLFTEGVRVRIGAAGKNYKNFRTSVVNNSQVRLLRDDTLPIEQPVNIGEGASNNVSKLILGENAAPIVQTVSGLTVGNTFAGSAIVGGATTNSTLTVNTPGNFNYTLPFGGAAANENNLNIVKSGRGTLTLSGAVASTHTGTTTVNGGTLLVNTSMTTSPLTVQAGGTVGGNGTTGVLAASGTTGNTANIAPGNNAVGTLTVNGGTTLGADSAINWQLSGWSGAAGTGYDTIGSAAGVNITATAANPVRIHVTPTALAGFVEENRSFTLISTTAGVTGFAANKFVFDAPGFTGTGSFSARVDGNNLVIDYTIAPPANNYTSWAATNGVTGGPAGDSDGDGIVNLLEYALNLNPAGYDANTGTFNAGTNTITFSKRAEAVTNGDLTYAIETSSTMLPGSWSPATPTTDTPTEISYTLPTGQGRIFARLQVTQNTP
ncbi:autotransporter-associated beta strand repeat-containing protein [Luteolibacter sp. GHJ8]|uniref:Autotransporter-associated beta strand repeat-containing protein n=1 Tax=Luteolibacter rhizosphaerae TaxID=2989719 RepID=A0ABT3FZZ2_9BACT|nr:autotransporter-associated beta strand repeat-containing protein [Luteolibacter rhizosphaerae]MCW1913163.1 autotransporter-associated beta strand repeat-containing protein [Luteolibacter rhizosphaerae]